jgi:hypothetical protein
MKDMNAIVDKLVEDIEIPEDVPVSYEVWAIGYDEEDQVTDAELLLATFEDPDQAVHYAKELTLADVVNFAADDECDVTTEVYSIHIEVETVVPDDEGAINIGTIYKKTLEIFEELPEFVTLSADEYEVIEESGYLQIPRSILKDYNKNDKITVKDAAQYFRDYYAARRAKGFPAEKKRCIYLRDDVTEKQIIANLVSNPVKALCESGFFFFNERDQVLSVSPEIWMVLEKGNKSMLTRICRQRLKDYYSD